MHLKKNRPHNTNANCRSLSDHLSHGLCFFIALSVCLFFSLQLEAAPGATERLATILQISTPGFDVLASSTLTQFLALDPLRPALTSHTGNCQEFHHIKPKTSRDRAGHIRHYVTCSILIRISLRCIY